MDRHLRGARPPGRGVRRPVSAGKPEKHLPEFRLDVHLVEALRQGPTGSDRGARFGREAGRRSTFLHCAFIHGSGRAPPWFPGGRARGVGLLERSGRRPIRGSGGGRDRADTVCASSSLGLHRTARHRGFAANGRPDRSVVCRYIPLPPTFENYLAGISTGLRANYRRRCRALQREHQAECLAFPAPPNWNGTSLH